MEAIDSGIDPVEVAVSNLVSSGKIEIPPFPTAAARLQQLIQSDDFALADMATIIETDQGLAADVMRCANSSTFSRGGTASSLNVALTRLGTDLVIRLALTSGLARVYSAKGRFAELRRVLWRRSFSAALICRALGENKARGVNPNEAFLCGLLHDVGETLTLSCIEVVSMTMPDPQARSEEYWQHLMDRFHVEVGCALADDWRLPALTRAAIEFHQSGNPPPEYAAMVEVVKQGDRVVALAEHNAMASAEDLAALGGWTNDAEPERIAEVLVNIPDGINAFLPAEVALRRTGKLPASLVTPQPSSLGDEAVANDKLFSVAHALPKTSEAYDGIAVTNEFLVIRGKKPMERKDMVRLQVGDGLEAFDMHAVVRRVDKEGSLFSIELQPFALDRQTFQHWLGLIQAVSG